MNVRVRFAINVAQFVLLFHSFSFFVLTFWNFPDSHDNITQVSIVYFATHLTLYVFILLGMVSNWEGATNEYAMNMNEHYSMNGLWSGVKGSVKKSTYLFEKYKRRRNGLNEEKTTYKRGKSFFFWIEMEMWESK